ncbi:MAG TPA: hypothetical protein DDW52_02895 [Planctomycetaceae bacterium]|nr:hypothetical protein [Planctomycetaceae bacterium]
MRLAAAKAEAGPEQGRNTNKSSSFVKGRRFFAMAAPASWVAFSTGIVVLRAHSLGSEDMPHGCRTNVGNKNLGHIDV